MSLSKVFQRYSEKRANKSAFLRTPSGNLSSLYCEIIFYANSSKRKVFSPPEVAYHRPSQPKLSRRPQSRRRATPTQTPPTQVPVLFDHLTSWATVSKGECNTHPVLSTHSNSHEGLNLLKLWNIPKQSIFQSFVVKNNYTISSCTRFYSSVFYSSLC